MNGPLHPSKLVKAILSCLLYLTIAAYRQYRHTPTSSKGIRLPSDPHVGNGRFTGRAKPPVKHMYAAGTVSWWTGLFLSLPPETERLRKPSCWGFMIRKYGEWWGWFAGLKGKPPIIGIVSPIDCLCARGYQISALYGVYTCVCVSCSCLGGTGVPTAW